MLCSRWAYYSSGQIYHANNTPAYGQAYSSGDTIGLLMDFEEKKLMFYRNSVLTATVTGTPPHVLTRRDCLPRLMMMDGSWFSTFPPHLTFLFQAFFFFELIHCSKRKRFVYSNMASLSPIFSTNSCSKQANLPDSGSIQQGVQHSNRLGWAAAGPGGPAQRKATTNLWSNFCEALPQVLKSEQISVNLFTPKLPKKKAVAPFHHPGHQHVL